VAPSPPTIFYQPARDPHAGDTQQLLHRRGIQPLMSGHAGGKRLAHVIYQLLVGAGDLLAAAATFGL